MAAADEPSRIYKVELLDGTIVTLQADEELHERLTSSEESVSKEAKRALLNIAKSSLEEHSESTDLEKSITFKWTKEAESDLLCIFKDIEECKKPVKNKWQLVADTLTKHGFSGFSPEQCRLKIKACKEKFLRAEKARNKSGNGTPSASESCSDEIETTFYNLPDVRPQATMSLESTSSSDCSEEKTKKDGKKRTASQELHDTEKRPRRTIDVMKDVLEDSMKRKEEAAKERHREKMGVMKEFIEIMKDIARK